MRFSTLFKLYQDTSLRKWTTSPHTIPISSDVRRKSPSIFTDMSRPTRKSTVWTLRKVSTRISLRMPRRLIRANTFRLFLFQESLLYTHIPMRRKVSVRISLRCSGSNYYVEAIMLVFSLDGSYVYVVTPYWLRCLITHIRCHFVVPEILCNTYMGPCSSLNIISFINRN